MEFLQRDVAPIASGIVQGDSDKIIVEMLVAGWWFLVPMSETSNSIDRKKKMNMKKTMNLMNIN